MRIHKWVKMIIQTFAIILERKGVEFQQGRQKLGGKVGNMATQNVRNNPFIEPGANEQGRFVSATQMVIEESFVPFSYNLVGLVIVLNQKIGEQFNPLFPEVHGKNRQVQLSSLQPHVILSTRLKSPHHVSLSGESKVLPMHRGSMHLNFFLSAV